MADHYRNPYIQLKEYSDIQYKIVFKLQFRGHPFSTCAKYSEKLTCFTLWYAHVGDVCVLRGNKVGFWENFAYVLNGWSFITESFQAIVLFHFILMLWS